MLPPGCLAKVPGVSGPRPRMLEGHRYDVRAGQAREEGPLREDNVLQVGV